MDIRLNNLNQTIIKCKKCPRLIKFIKEISTKKRKQNINEIYWGKPVPGFGDTNSKLAIIGLAPAAHGGTRTGRAFTGDKSGDFLFKCLHEVGISNSPFSKNLNDNLYNEYAMLKSENIDLISLSHEYDSSKAEFCLACHCKTGKVFELIVSKNDKRKMKNLGLNQFDLHFYQ